MKNDSIAPGMRPTTNSTAISGRNTPRPKARMRNVTRRPTPPATTPAANRYQGSRRMNARRFFHPSATRGLRQGARLNLCPHAALTTNPLFSPRRVGFMGMHGHAAQHASSSWTADRPDRVVDDPLIVGVTIGLLVLVPGIQDSIRRASGAVAGGAFALSVAVALIMLGLWGISANNRNLKHAVDLIAQVDHARKETIQLESTRYMQK